MSRLYQYLIRQQSPRQRLYQAGQQRRRHLRENHLKIKRRKNYHLSLSVQVIAEFHDARMDEIFIVLQVDPHRAIMCTGRTD